MDAEHQGPRNLPDPEELELRAELEKPQAEERKQILRMAIAPKKRTLEENKGQLESYDYELKRLRVDDHPDPSHVNPSGPTVLNDPITCPREQLVSALWRRILQYHVVLVRATPGSGKSTLSQLLYNYVKQKNPGLSVYWCSWPGTVPDELGRGYEKLLRYAFEVPPSTQVSWVSSRALYIIDEAQNSYGCKCVWNDYIKSLNPQKPPMIILFSSWGSATSRMEEATSITPVIITKPQLISIRPSNASDPSVFFTYDEYLDVVERVKDYESRLNQRFLPDLDVVNYVGYISNGHPSGVRVALDVLARSEKLGHFRKVSTVIDLNTALDVLRAGSDVDFALAQDPAFARGLPPRTFLECNPKVVDVLRDVLLNSCIEGAWESRNGRLHQADEAVNTCYRQSWLQAELAPQEREEDFDLERIVYIFPSILHQRCIERLLS